MHDRQAQESSNEGGVDTESDEEECRYSSCTSDPEHGGSEDCSVDDADIKEFLEEFSNEMLPNQATTKAQAILLILTYAVTAGLS